MPLPFEPVLGIAVGQVIALIVFTVSVLSWFVNIIQGNQPNGAPRPKNRPPRDPVQSELEKFLQEVVGGKGQQEKKRQPPPPPAQQKPQRTVNEKKNQKPKQQRPAKSDAPSQRPGERVAQSHLPASGLGQGIRSHLSEFMEPNRVDAAVRQDIDSAVRRDVGSDETAGTKPRGGAIHPLVQSLRDPQGVRQAILLNEILNKPKSLR